jgi:hypothetical protein
MKELRWEDVYRDWHNSLEDLGTPTDKLASFQDIPADRLPYYYAVNGVGFDWWPKKQVNELAASLLKDSHYLPSWETKKGTLHTAQELYKNIDSVEKQSAIWIMASIWDKEKYLPDDWRGNIFELLGNLFFLIRQAFPEVSLWHHASRDALPISIGTYYPAREFIHPQTYRHLIYLSAVETSVILANWQLVRFVPKQ